MVLVFALLSFCITIIVGVSSMFGQSEPNQIKPKIQQLKSIDEVSYNQSHRPRISKTKIITSLEDLSPGTE